MHQNWLKAGYVWAITKIIFSYKGSTQSENIIKKSFRGGATFMTHTVQCTPDRDVDGLQRRTIGQNAFAGRVHLFSL